MVNSVARTGTGTLTWDVGIPRSEIAPQSPPLEVCILHIEKLKHILKNVKLLGNSLLSSPKKIPSPTYN